MNALTLWVLTAAALAGIYRAITWRQHRAEGRTAEQAARPGTDLLEALYRLPDATNRNTRPRKEDQS